MRILVVDDEPAIHESYRLCFAETRRGVSDIALNAMAEELFGPNDEGEESQPAGSMVPLEHVHVNQGLEAVAAVEEGLAEGERFAVAFIDVRMPPGIDGKETARRIRALDPDINIVIVTGYSDFTPLEIARVAGPADKLFYIAKPFHAEEIVQTAIALAERWRVDLELKATRAALAEKIDELEDQKLELAANESKATHMANHDSLTDAPNRLAFMRTLAEHVRDRECFAMAMLDLDRFKLVNDSFGHLAGDELIRAVCTILQEQVGDRGFVARLGGDEFALLMKCTGEDEASMACERLIKACTVSFKVFGQSVQGSASIGVVVVEKDTDSDPIDVMRRADLALNEAKRAGRGVVRVYDDSMDESIRFRRQIEGGLSKAIANGELRMLFQPLVRRDGLEVVGFEALMRWTSPEYGLIEPGMFIPIAEESSLIHELGDWALDEAIRVVQQWPDQYVSVNFSPRQFRRHNFVGRVIERVQHAGVAPSRIQIEITETAIFDDAERAAETLYRLRQMGFRIALDDFGTGYSSLYNIRKFALDCLKIDKSFIDGMGRERESAAIVQSIIHLGGALGLEVVAEGVENDMQLQLLRVAGCSHIQGYHMARPMPEEQARVFAEQRYLVPVDLDAEEDELDVDDAVIPLNPQQHQAGNGTFG